jgi:hypothetical protein
MGRVIFDTLTNTIIDVLVHRRFDIGDLAIGRNQRKIPLEHEVAITQRREIAPYGQRPEQRLEPVGAVARS